MKTDYVVADPAPPATTQLASAGIVHDLGNLIQVAASAVNIVSRSPAMAEERSSAMLHRASSCLEQASALVRQTIGHAREPLIAIEDSCVTSCLADVVALIEAMDQPDLIVETDIEADLPRARCDPLALRSAVLNLVFNARDAMSGAGLVVLRGRSISRGLTEPDIAISVADNGVGMTSATIARAFDPFFTTKNDGLGGVGLPMVERFVRDAGGEIAIESAPGAGTTVTLHLPMATRSVKGGQARDVA
jgi:signal transduction histidine kinase